MKTNKELQEVLDEISAASKAQRVSERSEGIIITNKVPNTCSDCEFFIGTPSGYRYCSITYMNIGDENIKSDSCPIHPLPEEDVPDSSDDEYYTGWSHGWNACLRAIKKGAEPISC